MRLKSNSKRRLVGVVVCVAVLGLFGYGVLSPEISLAIRLTPEDIENMEEANLETKGNVQIEVKEKFNGGGQAANESGNGTITVDVEKFGTHDSITGTGEGDISVTILEFLQITIPKTGEGEAGTADVKMEANPVPGQAVTTENSAEFTVAGNNRNGFGVFVYAKTDPKLTNTNTSMTVDPITSSGISLDSFGTNTWGYSVTSANAADSTISYKPLAVLNDTTTAAYTVNKPSAGENLRLNCGAKVNAGIPAGEYSTGVVISAVAPATNWQPAQP